MLHLVQFRADVSGRKAQTGGAIVTEDKSKAKGEVVYAQSWDIVEGCYMRSGLPKYRICAPL